MYGIDTYTTVDTAYHRVVLFYYYRRVPLAFSLARDVVQVVDESRTTCQCTPRSVCNIVLRYLQRPQNYRRTGNNDII